MPDFQQRPFYIRTFYPTGDLGLRIMDKPNWSGKGVVFNRTDYKEVVFRGELGKTGVYVLVGSSEESRLPTVYIGEGDPVKDRLSQHHREKDFWEWAVFFVATEDSLNKAHVQYLESQLLQMAKDAKQCNLDNSQGAMAPTLSEAETAFAESFLQEMLRFFPLLNLNIFERTEATTNLNRMLYIEAKGIKATGYEDPKGFIVMKGSQVAKSETQSIQKYLSILRKDLLNKGVIVDKGSHFEFAQDQVFNSPSMASGVILGAAPAGPRDWKNSAGKTLKQLQEEAAGDNSNESL